MLMAKQLKTYVAGILLSGISLMPVLIAGWFSVSQAIICHQMEEALELEELEIVTLKTAEIIWLKAGKEILLEGKPFDIKKVKKISDSSIISGLYDHKEKALKKILVNLENDKKQNSRHVNITNFFCLFSPTESIQFNCLFSDVIKNVNYVCYKEMFRQNDYSLITAPPPRFI